MTAPQSGPPGGPPLHELVAARLCHDLVNPLSAIDNGVGLLALTPGDEAVVGLLAGAAQTAVARLALSRLAFGPAQADGTVAGTDVARWLARDPPAARLAVDWQATGALPRPEARAALLAAMCAASACGAAGRIAVAGDGAGGWSVRASAARPVALAELWALALGQAPAPPGLEARMVHFALLPQALAALKRRMTRDGDDRDFALRF